ncbi:PRA1 family protein 1 [Heterostelium album PN500]|uniref:PRA1 family protein 1 n=1 Tax=Heterostelium pallidum (strain ATCC 26659 / Pp 5 / PN500) TaxID=670386 RepID=D3BD12_HETP5|nr:PRA1 family protein 1 [Heterostelium album PN500]EFA80804.1 PRA1 family protein 1 [Heterostelium album PN500]|eukprot:XP_020432923.1 PRA1 family protein 1 [Heterostelium album PN500]
MSQTDNDFIIIQQKQQEQEHQQQEEEELVDNNNSYNTSIPILPPLNIINNNNNNNITSNNNIDIDIDIDRSENNIIDTNNNLLQQNKSQMNSYEFNNNVVGETGGVNNNSGIGSNSNVDNSTPLSPPSFLTGGGSSLNSSSSQTGSSLHQRLNFNVITSKVKEFKDTRLQNTRDWYLFVGKRDKYGVPTMSSATERVKENIIYFQTNYLILFFIFATYVIFTKPLFLLLLVLLALIHIYLNYVNPELPEIQKKIGIGLQIILSVYFLLSAGSDIVWLIGATLSIVLLHAAFHVPQSTDDSQVSFGSSSV